MNDDVAASVTFHEDAPFIVPDVVVHANRSSCACGTEVTMVSWSIVTSVSWMCPVCGRTTEMVMGS